MKILETNLVDIAARQVYAVEISFDDKIKSIRKINKVVNGYAMPGFIDAHVHIESSMLVPSEFARLAVVHGTVATVSDPHEIANVLGIQGVLYMIESGNKVNFKFYFGAPSCVPATLFETAGDEINVRQVQELMARDDIKYLAEMMNWPGVLGRDETVMAKIEAALRLGKPVDGHAPGLKGSQAIQYANAGITTDHECVALDEAIDKIKAGMKIAIREGSAAKNFEALFPLIDLHPGMVMFCSDDKHPDYLMVSHIDELVRRALKKGADLFNVLEAACITPIKHYKLDVGMLKVGDPSDFIVVDDLDEIKVSRTFINGQEVAKNGKSNLSRVENELVNRFEASHILATDLSLPDEDGEFQAITAFDGQLITGEDWFGTHLIKNDHQNNLANDILKLVVVNRYQNAPPAIAYVRNFGLKHGAIASSVAHDSHNIIATGVSDETIAAAINAIIRAKGGLSAVHNGDCHVLPLPVAGLMSIEDGYEIGHKYSFMDKYTKEILDSTLTSPFMTLSFMALLVIPAKKLSDKGLFDALNFKFSNVFRKNG